MKNTKNKPKKPSGKPLEGRDYIEAVLFGELNTSERLRALFAFDGESRPDEVAFQFQLWSKYFFPALFKHPDAPFHDVMDYQMARLYLGLDPDFVNLGFRGCAKTTRAGLFVAFCIINDELKRKRFYKLLSHDSDNSQVFVTDVYNRLVDKNIKAVYGNFFDKTETKREERMTSFTTKDGIKLKAQTIGKAQRGQQQDGARPDFQIFDDFETSKTLESMVITYKIWLNMEEAYQGRDLDHGVVMYLGQYLSESGNVHRVVERSDNVLITPIVEKNGEPTWPERFTKEDIKEIKKKAYDWAGDYLCEPSVGQNVYIAREALDKQVRRNPVKELAGFKMFGNFNPSHAYGMGADVAGGVGLDSSTTVHIDFSVFPNRVVATYKNNQIKPDDFGDEMERQLRMFGEPIAGVENNKYEQSIARLRQLGYTNIFSMDMLDSGARRKGYKPARYGWDTNSATKPKVLNEFRKAVEDGHLELSDDGLISECEALTRDHVMDRQPDPRLTTRHFDLLMAAAIAWQMRHFAEIQRSEEEVPMREPIVDPYVRA